MKSSDLSSPLLLRDLLPRCASHMSSTLTNSNKNLANGLLICRSVCKL